MSEDQLVMTAGFVFISGLIIAIIWFLGGVEDCKACNASKDGKCDECAEAEAW